MSGQSETFSRATVAALIVVGFAVQLWLATRLNVNWDEFRFLGFIHEHLRGTLDRPLQTLHVHLLAWVARLPVDEVGQVVAGRLFMAACQAGTLWLIWATARRMAGSQGALLTVLGFLAAEHTLAHAASFRADPLATVLLMLALHIIAVRRLDALHILVAAAAGATAALVTIKSVLYLPAFLGAAAWRLAESTERRDALLRLGAVAAIGLLLGGALLLWHLAQLHPAGGRTAASEGGGALRTTLLAGMLPRASELAFWVPRSLVPLTLVGLGLMAARRFDRARAMAIVLFAAPLLSLLFYRNAFPYFFPFILAPAMITAAFGGPFVAGRREVLGVLVVVCALGMTAQIVRVLPRDQSAQRAVLAAVHAAFPQPVGYIDRAGMVASFPGLGFFMSSWGMGAYHAAGTPVFADVLEESSAPLVVANGSVLRDALRGAPAQPGLAALLEADAALLRKTYIPHWGPIWVAGARLSLDAGRPLAVEIRVPGPYTVEAAAPLSIDGTERQPGAVIALDRGSHVVEAAAGGVVTLRYGDALPRPADDPPDRPVFWRF